jgi:hypothetical protein
VRAAARFETAWGARSRIPLRVEAPPPVVPSPGPVRDVSEQPLSVGQIALMFNAEVLSDDEAAEVLDRSDIARQAERVREWNRAVGVRARDRQVGA